MKCNTCISNGECVFQKLNYSDVHTCKYYVTIKDVSNTIKTSFEYGTDFIHSDHNSTMYIESFTEFAEFAPNEVREFRFLNERLDKIEHQLEELIQVITAFSRKME